MRLYILEFSHIDQPLAENVSHFVCFFKKYIFFACFDFIYFSMDGFT